MTKPDAEDIKRFLKEETKKLYDERVALLLKTANY